MSALKRLGERLAKAKQAQAVPDLPPGTRLEYRVIGGRASHVYAEIPLPELAEMARRKIAPRDAALEEMILDALDAVDGVRASNKPLPAKAKATKDRLSTRANERKSKLAAVEAALAAGDRDALVTALNGHQAPG